MATIERTFPNHGDSPAISTQLRIGSVVVLHVAFDFPPPKLGIIVWPLEEVTVVAMKEAAVNEDDGVVLPKD